VEPDEWQRQRTKSARALQAPQLYGPTLACNRRLTALGACWAESQTAADPAHTLQWRGRSALQARGWT